MNTLEMTEEEARQTPPIDVSLVIASKTKLRIPTFATNYLKKIIHQDDINDYIISRRNLRGIEFAVDIIRKFQAQVRVYGLENISDNRRYIFAANHPMGGLDGMALIVAVGQKFNNLKFPVNDILLFVKNFSDIFVPVNKTGRNNRSALATIDETFRSDSQLLMFPAGLCSRLQKGKIRDLEWRKTFVTKAIETQRDVIPVYITGRNSKFFYNLARLRKLIGLNFNVEMLYLVDEMYKQKGETIDLIFGPPIPYETLTLSDAQADADHIKHLVYTLEPSGKPIVIK